MLVSTWRNRIFSAFSILILLCISLIIDVTPVSAVSVVVNTTNDDENVDDSYCSLREAISAIKNNDGDYYGCTGGDVSSVITVPAGTYTVDDQLPVINTTITINGANAETTIIQSCSSNPTQVACLNDYYIFYSTGILTLSNMTLRYGKNVDEYDGGVIYNSGTLNIMYSIMTANLGVYGGAIKNNGDLYTFNSTFSSNVAKKGDTFFNGGAIYNMSGADLSIEKTTFSDNSAGGGGAVFGNSDGSIEIGSIEILNSTFSGNTTTNFGGAIYSKGDLTVEYSTFSENAASQGAGIYNEGTLNYTATIIANSTSGSDCQNSGTIGTNLNNLVEDESCDATYSGDPSLSPLGNYGGSTQTHALLQGSTAIDNGDSAGCPDTDQRGVDRPQPEGGACDIGAFEREPNTFTYLPLFMK